ncbi:hypothetical protein PF005_g3863 [Phytophthora fragariae]|uniref:Uncharacterized protein n=1 Tax=Phytophthora fragariae TaxID=53985 RepID=A0A6A3Z574_9STRA|nr:hypothetical protein PF005_g3863 [Phytophthora fragariae]
MASGFKEECLAKGAQSSEELPCAQSSCDSVEWGRLAGNQVEPKLYPSLELEFKCYDFDCHRMQTSVVV